MKTPSASLAIGTAIEDSLARAASLEIGGLAITAIATEGLARIIQGTNIGLLLKDHLTAMKGAVGDQATALSGGDRDGQVMAILQILRKLLVRNSRHG